MILMGVLIGCWMTSLLVALVIGARIASSSRNSVEASLWRLVAEHREQVNVSARMHQLTNEMGEFSQRMEKLDSSVWHLIQNQARQKLKVTDLATGMATNETEDQMGKRTETTAKMQASRAPNDPEGFYVDGKPVDPSRSPDSARAFAKPT